MLGFETLTMAPIDLALVETSLLTYDERAWLNAYHKQVRQKLEAALEGPALEFLKRATKAI
jgi:Xaa-Pro aminopeptidase